MRRSSQIRYINLNPNPQSGNSLLGRIVALVVGIMVFGVAVFVGAVFLAGIVGFALLGGLLFMIRMWWARRQMEKYEREHGDLSAEYTVVQEEKRR